MKFSRFNTFIFDLDGTVWNWKRLFPGVRKLIKSLRKEGKQVLFDTNNTMVSRKELAKKLRRFGIDADENDIINPSIVITEYLKNERGKVLVFGDGLKKDLREAGIKVSDDYHVDCVIVGQDNRFDNIKLSFAVYALKNGANFFSTARGRFFVYGNKLVPGTGALVELIEYVSGRKAILLGKPSDLMCQAIQLFVQSPREQTVIFGDELNSDVVLGKKCGYVTVLVKTGIDKRVKGKIRPDTILNSVADIKL